MHNWPDGLRSDWVRGCGIYLGGIILELDPVDSKDKNDDEDNKHDVNYHYYIFNAVKLVIMADKVRISRSFHYFHL